MENPLLRGKLAVFNKRYCEVMLIERLLGKTSLRLGLSKDGLKL